MGYFANVTPESVGIRSAGVMDFLDDVRRKGVEMHSLMVIRHGTCCAQGWWAPYGPEYPHPLYSFSKSLTAAAIGFAEQEGLLSLDEKLVDLFPDEIPAEPSENLKEATIHHLLCMSCGQETECMDQGPEWIRAFLAHPFPQKPGTFFKYNTAGTNMLAAILLRKTGQQVTEFLRTRLLEPLGIPELTCHRLADPDGVEMGGAGMKLTTESMARFTYFLLRRGKWEGRQLLRQDWFDRACAKQMETAGDSEGHVKDWAWGYGYQCWMCALPGSFRADGAYGQYGFVFPTLDLIVVVTAATDQTQSLLDSLMERLIPAVGETALPESSSAETLAERMKHLTLPALNGGRNPWMEERIGGRVWTADPDAACSSMEVLIGGSGLFDIAEGEVTDMMFSFEGDALCWTCVEDREEKTVTASLAGDFAYSVCGGHTFAATARWRSYSALELEVRRVDALSGTRFIFRFDGDEMRIDADDTLVTPAGLGVKKKNLAAFYTAQA